MSVKKPHVRRSVQEEILLKDNNISWNDIFGYVFTDSFDEDGCSISCTFEDVMKVLDK